MGNQRNKPSEAVEEQGSDLRGFYNTPIDDSADLDASNNYLLQNAYNNNFG